MRQNYRKQAELLLEILPEVAKLSCFALHGGTAINFFVRDMPREPFPYEEYEEARNKPVSMINKSLTDEDRDFLLSFDNAEPDWSLYSFEQFPAVRWKLQNLRELRDTNPKKHRKQHELLERVLSG